MTKDPEGDRRTLDPISELKGAIFSIAVCP